MSYPTPDPEALDDPVDLDDTLDLLNVSAFQSFKSRNPSWFLTSIGDTIRDYCGWHIYPIRQDTDEDCKIGNQGIVMLPTLNLKSVTSVQVNGSPVSQAEWEKHESGWIQLHRRWWRKRQIASVRVDFIHGFDKLPRAVELVGFELTSRTLQQPAGVVNDMTRGYVRYKFDEFGPVLSDNQKLRLAPYTLEMD